MPDFFDSLIISIDSARKTLLVPSIDSPRPTPAQGKSSELTSEQIKHIAGLMRVNHAGEVCAQALYQGQALTAQSATVKQAMIDAAEEEVDHLAWCQQRLNEFDSHPSLLNPLFYALSFTLGAAASAISDKLSLGFVAATEEQVCKHLREHLTQIPETDKKTRAILEEMEADEAKHATNALESGGIDFPAPIKQTMSLIAKLMTKTAYRI